MYPQSDFLSFLLLSKQQNIHPEDLIQERTNAMDVLVTNLDEYRSTFVKKLPSEDESLLGIPSKN